MGKYSSESSDEEKAISSDEESPGDSSEEESSKKRSKKSKHSHKKKKSKDKKRHKKKSKKQRKMSTSSSSGDSKDESDDESEWVVKRPAGPPEASSHASGTEDADKLGAVFKKPKIINEDADKPSSRVTTEGDEDEWMSFNSSLSTFSNDSKKIERRKQREQERELSSIDKPGQSGNELNPYWKDGGTGLPSTEAQDAPKNSQLIGDGGLNYLRKAFVRAKEQSKEEGRTLEEVISERYGSLETFLGMLEEAEKKAEQLNKPSSSRDRSDDRGSRFKRPNKDSDDEGDERSRRRDSDHSSSSRRHHHRSRHDEDRRRRRSRSRSRSRDRNRRDRERDSRSSGGWRKRKDSPERSSFKSNSKAKSPELTSRSIKESMNLNDRHKKSEDKYSSFNPDKIKQAERHSPEAIDEAMEKEQEEATAPNVLTDKEMNELSAKLLKAEMFGNSDLVDELKQKISAAEAARQEFIKNGGDIKNPQGKSTKVVTKVVMESSRGGGRRNKDKITETHKDGQRVRYFPDDDKQTLQNMFQREKMSTAADENALFARLAGKSAKTGVDYDIDDVFADKASSSKQSSKEQEREIRDVLEQEKQYKKVLDSCPWCFDGSVAEKHLILSVAEKSYLCVPPYQSLTEGHCLIVPMAHVSSATELDEDVWAEMQKFRKALVRMFKDDDQDMVIFETALFLKRHPHMYLECIPMPKETGELAPIYFKKAIQECETEWSQNKKLVELRNRDVRRAVPKGLPYFSVDFGDDSCGFAHVVEDERNFPRNFAHEIVGGMMELDHHLWRKQKKDDFKTQRNKVMEFIKQWAPFDWTRGDDN